MLKFILILLLIFTVITYITLLITVIAHELGHFYYFRKYKVPVEEFVIGCGPKLFSKGIFTFNLIPLYGYNKYDEEIFNTLPNKQKIRIYQGGAIANIMFAIFLTLPLFYFGYMELLAILASANYVSGLNLLPVTKKTDGYHIKKLKLA